MNIYDIIYYIIHMIFMRIMYIYLHFRMVFNDCVRIIDYNMHEHKSTAIIFIYNVVYALAQVLYVGTYMLLMAPASFIN